MMVDFSGVREEHIICACRYIKNNGVPKNRKSITTYVCFENEPFPAKYVLGVAYEIATKKSIKPAEYAGGKATATVLEELGFHVVNEKTLCGGEIKYLRDDADVLTPKKFKKELYDSLTSIFTNVKPEMKFDWLFVPKHENMPDDIRRIYNALCKHRNYTDFDSPGIKLSCDFFLPGWRLIIEVDERQHFTNPRGLSILNYPQDVTFNFDEKLWRKRCDDVNATDNDPPHRDEQRAYYDSLRDLLAVRNGYKIIRIGISTQSTYYDLECAINSIKGACNMTSTNPIVVAAVCVEAKPAANTGINHKKENEKRIALLQSVVIELKKREWAPHILLFPGGFFVLPSKLVIGGLKHEERIESIENQQFNEECQNAAKELGLTVVAGIDSRHQEDQLCVAWNGDSIVGIGRKVFPTEGEESENILVYADDIASKHRLAKIPNDQQILLCACYDMFGCNETAKNPGSRSRNILNLVDKHGRTIERGEDEEALEKIIEKSLLGWEKCVSGASVGLAAIHVFSLHGSWSGKAYWERHGIQAGSRVIGGRFAVGAAHFEPWEGDPQFSARKEVLPNYNRVVLAARDGKQVMPKDHFLLENEKSGIRALVRLYG